MRLGSDHHRLSLSAPAEQTHHTEAASEERECAWKRRGRWIGDREIVQSYVTRIISKYEGKRVRSCPGNVEGKICPYAVGVRISDAKKSCTVEKNRTDR